ncbi:helix-turn-helix domain-containing protein [Arthrobacter sp. K5]|uniref:Helix-turn-helix domain-containing protein n=1 Tax=Arthrobacter sp. K5 TaxID=2839623 RepID=A0AAU8EW39_9MICC
MAGQAEKNTAAPAQGPARFPRMLTLEQVQEILNVKSSLVYALVRNGELRAAQFGGRGVWRVREDDLTAYIDAAFDRTAERIASGQIPDTEAAADD